MVNFSSRERAIDSLIYTYRVLAQQRQIDPVINVSLARYLAPASRLFELCQCVVVVKCRKEASACERNKKTLTLVWGNDKKQKYVILRVIIQADRWLIDQFFFQLY